VLAALRLGLKLDNQDVGRAGLSDACPNGCRRPEVVMERKLLGSSARQNATFIIFETPEEGIGSR